MLNDKTLRKLWHKMFERSYNKKSLENNPTYTGCSVSLNFSDYQYFKDWCVNQTGFNSVDLRGNVFHLDKDILVKGNKVYSEATCCFVPKEINGFYTKANKIRGLFAIGVYFDKRSQKFIAGLSIEGKYKILGQYDNEWSAFIAYKQAKENRAKELAEKWRGQIDNRVYEKLINYKVLLTD